MERIEPLNLDESDSFNQRVQAEKINELVALINTIVEDQYPDPNDI